jgi:hypothetical protein
MKVHVALYILGVLLMAATAAFLLTGCEVDSADSPISISPSAAAIKVGRSVEFTASGGYEYQWSLTHPEWGGLSTERGPQTTYTSFYDPPSNTVQTQTLRLTSTITGAGGRGGVGGGSTNTAAYVETASANITHIPSTQP